MYSTFRFAEDQRDQMIIALPILKAYLFLYKYLCMYVHQNYIMAVDNKIKYQRTHFNSYEKS
jgi:cell division protein FtsL